MEKTPEINYTLMRVSQQRFKAGYQELDEQQRQQVEVMANRELAISEKLLNSDAAVGVIVAERDVESALAELRSRFDSDETFSQSLECNGLGMDELRQAISHELRVEAIMERLLSDKANVSDEEAEIYYYQHIDKFELPQTRTARHILITVNPDYPENSESEAKKRLLELHERLQQAPETFSDLASRYSECPTAMNGGELGRLKPGQLYPQLDQALFQMEEGECSDILTSPVGLHLLLCERVHPAGRVEFAEVRAKLREHLESKKRKNYLRDWLQKQAA